MEKIIKTRKEHCCSFCGKLHKKGSKMIYSSTREPVYSYIKDKDGVLCETQIGIKYENNRYCWDGKEEITMPPCVE